MSTKTVLNPINAKNVATVSNIQHPEWGSKKFNYNEQSLGMNRGYCSTVGSGSNSAILHDDEFHFWQVETWKRPTAKDIGIKTHILPFISTDALKAIAVLRWHKDNKVFVGYLYACMQMQVDGENIPKYVSDEIEEYCTAKGLQLWSY